MELLDNDKLQRMVDYSFGDQSGVLGCIPQAFMSKANCTNLIFDLQVAGHKEEIMTLFIDNIRLYRRPIEFSDWLHMKPVSEVDRKWLDQFEDEDLLQLCSEYPQKKFIIFTAFEDTPLDNYIWGRIPENVIGIHSANGVIFGDKIHPFPHGLERSMYHGYNHQELLKEAMIAPTSPSKLLFICHREDTGARGNLRSLFAGKDWATVAPSLGYSEYLKGLQDHKFVLCPSGNGIESARNWETLYLKRIPIMIKHPYMLKLYKGLPVLWVNSFEEVTEELLKKNESLFDMEYDRNLLDLNYQFNSRI